MPPPPEAAPRGVGPEAGRAPRAPLTDAEKARKALERLQGKDRDAEMKALRRERYTTKTLAEAKATLAARPPADMAPVSWITVAPDAVQSAAVATFIDKLATNADLRNDPYQLLYETVRLSYATSSEAAPEVLKEISQIRFQVREHIRQLIETSPATADIHIDAVDEALYGGKLVHGAMLSEEMKKLFDDDDAQNSEITDPEVLAILKEFQRNSRVIVRFEEDLRNYDDAIRRLARTGAPEYQVKEANARLAEVKKSVTPTPEKSRTDRMEEMNISHLTVDDLAIPDAEKAKIRILKGNEPLALRNINPQDLELLKLPDGPRIYFLRFLDRIYSMGRAPDRPELVDQQEWSDFQRYLEWRYPDNSKAYTDPYQNMWKEATLHSQIIKRLLYEPGDIKDKLKNLRFLSGADMDFFFKQYDHTNAAWSLYENTLFNLLSGRRAEYDAANQRLMANYSLGGAVTYVDHNGRLTTDVHHADKDHHGHARVAKVIDRYEELMELKKKGRDVGGRREFLTPQEAEELRRLQTDIDKVGFGVMLWDADIQNNAELSADISRLEQRAAQLRSKDGLTPDEQAELDRIGGDIDSKRELARQRQQQYMEYESPMHELHETSGMSPVDRQVFELLCKRQGLDLKTIYNMPTETPAQRTARAVEMAKVLEIRYSVNAARMAMIGSGRMVSIGSGLITRPNFELRNQYKNAFNPKHIMRAPAFEDLQRVINPDIFFDRFGFLGRAGEPFRAMINFSAMEQKGFKFRNDPRYRRDEEAEMDPFVRKTREFVRQIQDETGIPYTEMILQGFFKGGGDFDKTNWRMEDGGLDEVQQKLLAYIERQRSSGDPAVAARYADARVDNVGLGVQFAGLGAKEGKAELFQRMVRRNPGKFFQIIGSKGDEILSGAGLQGKRDRVMSAFALLDTELALNKDRSIQSFDVLTNRAHFNELVLPQLQKLQLEGDAEAIWGMLQRVNGELPSFAQKVSSMELPITLTLADIDLREASFMKEGAIAFDRRGRDMEQMAGAREAMMMLQNPTILLAKDRKELFKAITQFRSSMGGYVGPGDAEDATYLLIRSYIEYSRNRSMRPEGKIGSKEWFGSVGRTMVMWAPGGEALWKALAHFEFEVDEGSAFGKLLDRFIKPSHGHSGRERFNHAWEHQLEKMQSGLSYAHKYSGTARSNCMNETEIDHFIDELEELGIFTEKGNYYLKLRKEFHATIDGQIYGAIRRYWWLIPLATAGMAVTQATEEEKKGGGGGHH